MEARLPPRRLLTCAAALVLLVVPATGCGGGSSAAHAAAKKDPAPVRYSGSYLSFTHPPAWTASAPRGSSELHFHPIVYLSTQPVHAPCTVHGNETDCDWPVDHLRPRGMLALWQFPYSLGFVPRGKRMQVGGSPAWRTDQAGGACRRIGADRTTEVDVKVGQNLVSLTACLRRPGLEQSEKSLDALLASTKFAAQ
jgi:hypothetical protein